MTRRMTRWLAGAAASLLAVAPAFAAPALLYLKVDPAARSLRAAAADAAIVGELTPLLREKLEASDDLRNVRVVLKIDPARGRDIGVGADVDAEYRYVPGFEQWAPVSCRLEAVLRLTSSRVRDARIELANPNGIARRCTGRGALAEAAGDYGAAALTALVNARLGRTPLSQPVRQLLDRADVRQTTERLLGVSRVPDDTAVTLAGCVAQGKRAICGGIDLP